MKIFLSKNKLTKITNIEKNLGFVPTMGAIHEGHISLVKRCISQCNKTIVSIFINKSQFNKESDFQSYPRVLKKDISILKRLRGDYLYLPTNNQIYPSGQNKNLKGDIEYEINISDLIADTLKFSFQLIDRALHESNIVESPDIRLN